MTHTISKRGTVRGPAVGISGAGLGGPVFSIGVGPGQYVGTISAKLRTRNLTTPIQPGSVLVVAVLVPSGLVTGAVPGDSDAIESAPGDWQKMGYVSTGQGVAWHPNVWVNPGDESYQVVFRVWNRDDLDSTEAIIVDVSVTTSARPVAGVDTSDPTFAIGTGTRRSLATANPVAGAEIITAVPQGALWFPHGLRAILVCDGTASSRIAFLTCFDGTIARNSIMAGILAQTAGTTWVYAWSSGAQMAGGAGSIATVGGSAGFYARAGDSIRTGTLNLVVGDNWGAGQLDIEEWIVPQLAA